MYPEQYHDDHNDVSFYQFFQNLVINFLKKPSYFEKLQNPLAPQRMQITYNMLSPEAKRRLALIQKGVTYNQTKLVSSFLPKDKYVTHYLNLKYYLSMGVICERIYRVIKFQQKKFCKTFIEECTTRRKESKTKVSEKTAKNVRFVGG